MARSGWTANSIYVIKSSTPITAAPITLACWYNPSTFTGSDACLLAVDNSGATNMFDIQVPAATKISIAETGAANSFVNGTDGGSAMVTATWYHICGVIASATSRIAYRNGVAGTANTTSKTPSSLAQMVVGSSTTNVNTCHGTIAFPAIWNVALSAADVLSLANGAHPRMVRPDGLVACLNLSGDVTAAPDLVSATVWTVTGTLTDQPNPRIFMR